MCIRDSSLIVRLFTQQFVTFRLTNQPVEGLFAGWFGEIMETGWSVRFSKKTLQIVAFGLQDFIFKINFVFLLLHSHHQLFFITHFF